MVTPGYSSERCSAETSPLQIQVLSEVPGSNYFEKDAAVVVTPHTLIKLKCVVAKSVVGLDSRVGHVID